MDNDISSLENLVSGYDGHHIASGSSPEFWYHVDRAKALKIKLHDLRSEIETFSAEGLTVSDYFRRRRDLKGRKDQLVELIHTVDDYISQLEKYQSETQYHKDGSERIMGETGYQNLLNRNSALSQLKAEKDLCVDLFDYKPSLNAVTSRFGRVLNRVQRLSKGASNFIAGLNSMSTEIIRKNYSYLKGHAEKYNVNLTNYLRLRIEPNPILR